LGLDAARKAGRRLLDPLVRILARTGLNPSAVTVTGFAMSGAAAWLVANGSYWQGAVVLFLGSILDGVDGGLARQLNRETTGGAVLDSSLDRVSEMLVLAAILVGPAGREHGSVLYLVPAALGGSFMVSYIRARAEGEGIDCSVGLFSRVERLVLLIVGLFVAGLMDDGSMLLVWMLAAITAGSWLTAGQRLIRVIRMGRRSRSV
jgi:CDP-diacylglycerol--glycerol-3-phosphate 3-phosphatidyltransferase